MYWHQNNRGKYSHHPQGSPRKPSLRAAVPRPSDIIPENVTIEKTDLSLENLSDSEGSGQGSGISSGSIGHVEIFQPRPIFEVIPEYPEELQKKRIEDMVKLHLHIDETGRVIKVVVLENTTGSTVCATAAKEAALKRRYIPPKTNSKPGDLWITRTYTFSLQK